MVERLGKASALDLQMFFKIYSSYYIYIYYCIYNYIYTCASSGSGLQLKLAADRRRFVKKEKGTVKLVPREACWAMVKLMQLTWCLVLPSVVSGDWAETINSAGMQRTLSQQMTKEFLLISRGTKVAEYKEKLSLSISALIKPEGSLQALSYC